MTVDQLLLFLLLTQKIQNLEYNGIIDSLHSIISVGKMVEY